MTRTLHCSLFLIDPAVSQSQLKTYSAQLITSAIADYDHFVEILVENLARATECLIFSAEALGADPLISPLVPSQHCHRLSVKNPICHILVSVRYSAAFRCVGASTLPLSRRVRGAASCI